eukprot:m.891226 g.891226  ORF g.891226 m.891226 type:complete len:71 (+) comp23652_c1_seq59:209-421(+)
MMLAARSVPLMESQHGCGSGCIDDVAATSSTSTAADPRLLAVTQMPRTSRLAGVGVAVALVQADRQGDRA